jgi:cytochrome c oxidase subunit 2
MKKGITIKKMIMENLINLYRFDAPTPFGVYFQDSATPLMEIIIELHDYVMYFMLGILGVVS